MKNPPTLAHDFALAAPYGAGSLLSEAALEPITRVTQHFPPLNAGFECRMGNGPAPVDISLYCTRETVRESHIASLARHVSPRQEDTAGMEQLCHFLRDWHNPHSRLFNDLGPFWLEFDLDVHSSHIPVPRVFAPLHRLDVDANTAFQDSVEQSLEKMFRILDHLFVGAVDDALQSSLKSFSTTLPKGASLFSVGTAIVQRPRKFRMTIIGVSVDDLPDWLAGLPGWNFQRAA
ncbi:hypothetical protein [Desulfovibrio inopinatus]|uniref:hypothetical protein n=1 Tax=Desulfovibrio inopinatus TaxID=102109 RepID=UPI000402481F|nr:hypothetical protein [Desulfovibrio inopinatus]